MNADQESVIGKKQKSVREEKNAPSKLSSIA
jgi:hypothetical protein